MHKLINISTNNYVTLLPLQNGIQIIFENCKYDVLILMRMRETSSYLKLSLATLSIIKLAVLYLLSQDSRTFNKMSHLCRFVLINVNDNFFVGLLLQLN